ncbi:hypothetical protein Clacol_001535 [Clathrus columnatus]|uniref:TRP C-terminal domain-containing protein n=1 Tax=Clathrus columnatus TaxID=1419009 RepID=A0AAV4ZYG1_9AGAM|nr:hypothetical protein Clacol_001535 [Clathrus columnatus]
MFPLHAACIAATLVIPGALAQIASLSFQDCSSSSSSTSPFAPKISISTGLFIVGLFNQQAPILATVFAPTQVLTFILNRGSNSQFALCQSLRPPSPLPSIDDDAPQGFCPIQPGPVAFSVSTSLDRSYELMTLDTQIRVLDTSTPAQELACVNVLATPLSSRFDRSVYGQAVIVFWTSVGLAIGYFIIVGAGRIAAAWKRGRQRSHVGLWSQVQRFGLVLASAISGERFASSPALIRFSTPSMRDIIFHTQWCTLLGMVAVQWSPFAYPFFAQTAWSSLLYNITLTQGSFASSKHWNPLHTDQFAPPSNFEDQIKDPNSPLFLDTAVANTLFTLPSDIPKTGIPVLAATVGIRAQDVFNNAAALFLLILAGAIVLSIFIFIIDWFFGSVAHVTERTIQGTNWLSHKEVNVTPEPLKDDDVGSGSLRFQSRILSRGVRDQPMRKGWLSYRLGQSSFHGSVLHGNLVRVLILFHLPITVFSCYQFSSGKSHSSLASVILAAICFSIFSVSIPVILVFKIFATPTNKLYDETRTLLALGPLYNQYSHGSQLFACLFFASNIAYGVTIGCGQRSGTAQSIIILVIEVAAALTTSIWLPWGRGATMGGISFLLCVSRIITAVLLVILSPAVSVGNPAAGWISYAILVLQGIVYLGFGLMLISKALEGIIRLFWRVSFDRNKHGIDTGLIGTIGLATKRNSKQTIRLQEALHRPRASQAGSDLTAQRLLAPNIHTIGSRTTVSGPPSVLRPEHLNQPYREDSDDETGYILGAWRYDDDFFTEPLTPPAAAPAPTPSHSSTGFSRVAGGRANMDSPFTMAPGTSTTFENTTSRTVPSSPLPPGAMPPVQFHTRRKSQSAIIEDATFSQPITTAVASPAEALSQDELVRRNDDIKQVPRRKNWLQRALFSDNTGRDRRRLRHELLLDEQDPLEGSSGSPGTFVVIRERKPSPLSQAQLPEGHETRDEL